MYIVDFGRVFRKFHTYEEAVTFCIDNGIHPENIYEEEEKDEMCI